MVDYNLLLIQLIHFVVAIDLEIQHGVGVWSHDAWYYSQVALTYCFLYQNILITRDKHIGTVPHSAHTHVGVRSSHMFMSQIMQEQRSILRFTL